MAEPISDLNLDLIAARRKFQWMQEAKKRLDLIDRIVMTIPWWLVIIFIGLFALSASHTAAVFSELSPIGYAGPFVVEFALLWAAFVRVTGSQRISSAMRTLEVLAFVMALVANGLGALARVAALAGVDKLSADALLSAYRTLPLTTQAYIMVIPFFALFIPVGTWVSGEGIANLVIRRKKTGTHLEEAWSEVQVVQLAQAIYAELIKTHEPGVAKRLSASMSTGYYNVMRTPVRLDNPPPSAVRVLPEPSTVSATTVHKPVRIPSRTGKTASNPDARKTVREYLEGHPDAISMSVRQLASAAGVSKSLAAEELSAWKASREGT